jgi:hypothetical protein
LSHCSAGKAELSLALATLSSLCLAMASRACYAGPTARHCAPLCAQLSRGPSLCVMPRALPRAVGALASVVHRTASWLPCWACDSVEWARLLFFVLPHALAGHLQEDMEQHPAPDRRGIAHADGVADAFDGFRSDLPCRGQGACHMPCCIPRVHVPCRHVALYANTFVQAPVRMWETGMGGPSDRGSRFGPKTSQAPCELTVSFAHRLRRMTSST